MLRLAPNDVLQLTSFVNYVPYPIYICGCAKSLTYSKVWPLLCSFCHTHGRKWLQHFVWLCGGCGYFYLCSSDHTSI